ncbi:MAG: ABC transporter substrate-binding protein [Lachnospiraceae bacterium]|nr:ABC transporter substrate-binding protein [Lachnospiraceae bacterium]
MKINRRMRQILLTGTAVMMLGGMWAGSVSAEETEPIQVGTLLSLGTATPLAAEQLNYFSDAGLNVEVREFADGAAIMEAFAAGELDMALVGIAPAATWYNRGAKLQVVAGANGGGHVVMTREDTGINTVEDLAGKLVAEPSIATVTDAMLRSKILAPAGIDPNMDVTLISGMKPADMATALMATKEVEAMITWEPYASLALQDYDDIKIVYDAAPEIQKETGSEHFYPGNVLIASTDFIEESPDLLESYLAVHKQTIEYLNTDEGANALLAGLLELDESVVESARERTDFQYDLNPEAAMEILQWSVDQSYLDELPDQTEFFRQN